MKKISVVAIVGPTATGKTRLAIELAKKIDGEIINADSMQIYKGLDIGTAKPDQKELDGIPYHLIDIVDNKEEFNIADYVGLAHEKIAEITSRGKIPMLVGGTGLYIDMVLNSVKLEVLPEDRELREQLSREKDELGIDYLFDKLKDIDPQAAQKINKNNVKRVIRALEINYLTGKTLEEGHSETRAAEKKYNPCFFGLNYSDREILYENINKRVDQMMLAGLESEARDAFFQGMSKTASQAIGYKEFFEYFLNGGDIDEVVLKIKQNTRKYAKRQLTWFKRNNQINWINMDEYQDYEKILNFCLKVLEKSILI